jgi:hypothetical protein
MTPCIPLTIITPAALSLAGIRAGGDAASTRPGPAGSGQDRSGRWLRNAAAGLCALAAAAATVSFAAQYQMIDATRHLTAIAALEAAIPDTAALVFACLGIALALRGRRALRARTLNLASVAASVFMNTIAAAPGWRNLAIWAMPPIAYALASDTLIGVIRVIARHQHPPRAWRNRAYRRTRHLPAQPPREVPPAARWSEPVIPRHMPGGLTSGNFLWN